MLLRSFRLAGALLVMLSSSGVAQEYDVARRTFTFLQHDLTIDVVTEAPGVLHLIRGGDGLLEVAARSGHGFAGFGLGGLESDRLTLSAVGAERVNYLVAVPEYVRIRIHLPDRQHVEIASTRPSATYRWDAAGAVAPAAMPAAMMPPTLPGGLYLAHAQREIPLVVSVPDLTSVRLLEVRVEGDEFRIAASRPLAQLPGPSDRYELRLDGPPLEVVLFVPRTSARFTLQAAGATAFVLDGGTGRTECSSVTRQEFGDGRSRYTFTPDRGRLSCGRG